VSDSSDSPQAAKRRRTARWVIFFYSLGLGAWWVVSILVHTAIFGVFYIATPPTPSGAETSSEFNMTISPDRVRDVVEEIRERESERFEEKVEELVKIKEELDKLNAEKIAQYNEIMREEAQRAPENLAAAGEASLSAQKEALAQQTKAEEALAKLNSAHQSENTASTLEQKSAADAQADAAAKEAAEARAAAELAQRKALVAQNEIGDQLQLMNQPAEAGTAHAAATESQTAANKTQERASSTANQVLGAMKALPPAEEAASREKAALEKVTQQATTAEATLAARQDVALAAQKKIEEAKEAAAVSVAASTAATSATKTAAEESKRLANEARQSGETAKKEQSEVSKVEQEVKKAETAAQTARDLAAKQEKQTAATVEAAKQSVATATPTPSDPDGTPSSTPPLTLTPAQEAARQQQTAFEKAAVQAASAEAALNAKKEALSAAKQEAEAARKAAADIAKAAADAAAAVKAAEAEKQRQAALAKQSAESVKKEENAAAKAQQDLRQAEGIAKRAQEAAAKQEQKLAETKAKLEEKEKALKEGMINSSTQQKTSTEAQQASILIQQAANTALAKAAAEFSAGTKGATYAAEVSSVPAPHPTAADGLSELYKKAQAAEEAVAETFKNVRAAELAVLRKIPLEAALALTVVAKPDRPELDNSILDKDIADVNGVREQEKAISEAAAQMDSMVALAQRMRDLANAAGSTFTVAQVQAQSARNSRMEELAMEDAGTKAKDLSKEMAAADGPQGGMQGQHSEGMSPQILGVSLATAVWASTPLNPKALADLANAMNIAAAMAANRGTTSGTPGQGPGGQPGIASVSAKDFKPIPGRTVRKGMVSIEAGRNPAWMYVDSWYLIGPWPNPGRKNLNTKFPPETVIDLDAVYQGGRKNEVPMPIRWHFFQLPPNRGSSPTLGMIVPPGLSDYELYYAYAEIWFDEESDLWVAIGSDDQSKVWINDQLIWKSADFHKSWVANEGLRKVHFRKGINRLLYRLENGQQGGGFSFLVCLSEPQ